MEGETNARTRRAVECVTLANLPGMIGTPTVRRRARMAAVARARVAERREGDCEKAQHFLSGTTRTSVATRRDARVETRWYATRDCFARLTGANGVAPRVRVDERWTASDMARGAVATKGSARVWLFICVLILVVSL